METRSRNRGMAEANISESFLRLKAEAESLGLQGKDVMDYIKEARQQARQQEAEKETQRLAAEKEAEVRRLAAEAEIRRLEAEKDAEVRRLQAEEKDKERQYRAEKDARDHELEMRRLDMQRAENSNNSASDSGRAREQTSAPNKFRVKLDYFDDKDDLEAYLRTFERTAKTQQWPDNQWSSILGSLLKGKARETYSLMSDEEAANYNVLRDTLLNKFRLTAEEYRRRFRAAKRLPGETTPEFATKLDMWLTRWQELAGKKKSYEDLRNLFIVEKFIEGIPFDQARFVLERVPKDIEEAVATALVFETAKQSANSTHERAKPFSKSQSSDMKEGKVGEARTNNKGKEEGEKQRSGGPKVYTGESRECFFCHKTGHIARHCQSKRREVPAVVAKSIENAPANSSRLCAECTQIPFSPECTVVVEGVEAKAIRDTGASITIVDRGLVPESCKTGQYLEVMLAASTERQRLPLALVQLNTPYFEGKAEVALMEKPVYPVLLGNYRRAESGQIFPVPVYAVMGMSAAVQTREGAKRSDKPLKVAGSLLGDVTPKELGDAQRTDPSLDKVRQYAAKGTQRSETANNKVGSVNATYEWKKGILFRTFCQDGKMFQQVVVPQKFRQEVLRLAHDTPMAGHLGVSKTKARIWNDFTWPGICGDVRRYCASCDACQRSTPKGSTRRVPLGKMPVISTAFERVAVDLIGPIMPASARGHRYILTMIDYATRYMEAKPLKSITAEVVSETLWEMWTRLGVPREVLTDCGSQFVGNLATEVNKLLSIKGIHTTPWHPQGNGLVERFNGTLKTMLKHLCQEQPKEWDRIMPGLLFAIREVPQESLQFSPFELLYARTVRGPMQILKELWTNEDQGEELRATFQYVVDLRNQIEDTCRMARENLAKASARQAKYFNRKTKDRQLKVGNKVLVLLPDKTNKLQMLWKGPYVVTDKVNNCDYRVEVGGRERLYHINVLKQYVERLPTVETHIVAVIMTEDDEDFCAVSGQKPAIPLPSMKRTEGPEKVHICAETTPSQKSDLEELIHKRERVFSDLPGRSDKLVKCDIPLEHDKPVFVRQYPLPYAKVQAVGEEVEAMLKLGVIEPASSPYNAPVVLIQKKDGSNRFCIDYRKLNQQTRLDAEPIPDVNQLFAKLANKKFFSKLDLCKGYWQIAMAPEDKEKSAFSVAQGQFQWNVLPFGLKNAGGVFSRFMRKLLQGIDPDAVSNFIDDIMIATDTWERHLEILGQVLERLERENITAKPSKCFLGYRNLSFLGHEISVGMIQPEEDKLEKIRDAEQPKTKKDLRAFLGLVGFYRRFIPQFADIALPLTDRTKKGCPELVKWTEECERAFRTLKEKLIAKPIMILPDVNKPFVLRTDASDRGIGAVLMQDQGDGLHPVAYASKKLLDAETRYATIEKECMAIVWGVKKFEPYLYGTKFIIETDHKPLLYLQKSKTENGRLMRWALQLQQYTYSVRVIAGKDNVGADYLSRSF